MVWYQLTRAGALTVGPPDSLTGQLVKIWRLNLTAIAPEVREPEVIGEYQKDVGSLFGRHGVGEGSHQTDPKET